MPNKEARSVSEHQFPYDGTAEEKLTFCVRYAILGPSIYNTQPWQFEINGKECRVFADRRYALPVIDPDDRSLVIACSAAVFSLRTAINYFGYDSKLEILPASDKEDLIAKVTLGDKKDAEEADDLDKALFKSIVEFEKNHGIYSDKKVSNEDIEEFKTACLAEGAWLYICDEDEKKTVVKMVTEADHIQSMNKNFRREICQWIDKRREGSFDGLPEYGVGFSHTMNQFSPHIIRRFEGDNKEPISDIDFADSIPMLAILGTFSGGAKERIMTGQAFMRLCLLAHSRGLSVSTLNQVCEVPEMRLRLHDEINQQGRAHIIMRIGYGGKPKLYARRPLSQCLKINGKPYVAVNNKEKNLGKTKKKFWSFR